MRKWNQKMYKQALRFERLEFCEQSRRFHVEETLILSVQLKIKLRTKFFARALFVDREKGIRQALGESRWSS